jgi:hypothetical protein
MAALSITLRQGVCPRAQMRPTRLLRPDGLTDPNTSWPDPHGWPGYEWRQHDIIVMSACTVGMPGMTSSWCKCDVSMHSRHAMSAATSSTSQQTCQRNGTHLPRHQLRAEPHRAELSRAELEPSRAASQGTGSSVADPTCNRIWDWIWAVDQARIVLIKS